MQVIKEYCKHFKVKSRTLSIGQLTLVLEFTSDDEKDCADALHGIDGVHSVEVLAHDGKVTF